jgi:hypothetical protein
MGRHLGRMTAAWLVTNRPSWSQAIQTGMSDLKYRPELCHLVICSRPYVQNRCLPYASKAKQSSPHLRVAPRLFRELISSVSVVLFVSGRFWGSSTHRSTPRARTGARFDAVRGGRVLYLDGPLIRASRLSSPLPPAQGHNAVAIRPLVDAADGRGDRRPAKIHLDSCFCRKPLSFGYHDKRRKSAASDSSRILGTVSVSHRHVFSGRVGGVERPRVDDSRSRDATGRIGRCHHESAPIKEMLPRTQLKSTSTAAALSGIRQRRLA